MPFIATFLIFDFKSSYLKSRNRHTNVQNKGMDTEGLEVWDELGVGIDIYTLLYIKEITNENLLYSTRNSPQCCVVT